MLGQPYDASHNWMGQSSEHFDQKLAALDLSLFDAISSQSVKGDRIAWLRLQQAARKLSNPYAYLEIGSHLGGSIQNHLVDVSCSQIYSIDKRPPRQPDDRGQYYEYENNSTERMLQNLRNISPEGTEKIHCFDSDAAGVDLSQIKNKPQLCFIDGEHTQPAVKSDFQVCLEACDPDGMIAFHDDNVIWPAILAIRNGLQARKQRFKSVKLGGSTFVFLLGRSSQFIYPDLLTSETDGDQFLSQQQSKARFETWIRKPARALVPSSVRKTIKPWFKSLVD